MYAVAVAIVFVSAMGYLLTKTYHARMLIVERKRMGLPIAPGHSLIFGHLLYLKTKIDALPQNAHYQLAFGDIMRQHFPKKGVFYVDLWPVSSLFMVVVSPQLAIQAAQTSSIACERPYLLKRFFKPIAGGPNLFDLAEKEWKPWRGVFNKGFNSEHILSLVPGMTRTTRTYCDTLGKLAQKRELFHLDTITLRFTIDMIGETILNTTLGAQHGYNVLADCMLSQIRWHPPNAEANPFEYLNFARLYIQWQNGRKMNDYIGKELDKRYQEHRADPANKRTKAVIDLVLQAYTSQDMKPLPERLDPSFRKFAIRQIRLFVFAGHDSTSSTICYILHLLSKNPGSLARLRVEHDTILGCDPFAAETLLASQPQLTRSLVYTNAVAKEALRLFTPAGGSRAGKPGVSLVSDEGKSYPTDEAMLLLLHTGMHRSPEYWPRPDEFIPERWLVEPGHELYPTKGAWRSFEHGPRNCIAQGLVMIELSVVLAMVARQFDLQPAYEEWDRLHPRKGLMTYRGERAYQVEEGAAHPVDKYPCRVSLRGPRR